jgi:hypothetical protein
MAGALASLLPWDALFAAGFAYSGYRTLGRWFKYTDDAAKAVTGKDVTVHARQHSGSSLASARCRVYLSAVQCNNTVLPCSYLSPPNTDPPTHTNFSLDTF